MKIPFVDLTAQYKSIEGEIDAAISEVISKSAFIGGPHVKSFEAAFAEFCNVNHCVGLGNGTDALCIALKTLGIGKGDEVITTALSFIATSEAITMAGARVVFVDINPETYNIDVAQIEEKISSNTKAIIPVHLYGQPADMDPILNIATTANSVSMYLSAITTDEPMKGVRNDASVAAMSADVFMFALSGCSMSSPEIMLCIFILHYPDRYDISKSCFGIHDGTISWI